MLEDGMLGGTGMSAGGDVCRAVRWSFSANILFCFGFLLLALGVLVIIFTCRVGLGAGSEGNSR